MDGHMFVFLGAEKAKGNLTLAYKGIAWVASTGLRETSENLRGFEGRFFTQGCAR